MLVNRTSFDFGLLAVTISHIKPVIQLAAVAGFFFSTDCLISYDRKFRAGVYSMRTRLQFIQRVLGPFLIAVCAQFAFSGFAQSQEVKLVPQGSIGNVRTVVSLAVSHKLKTKKIKTISASFSRVGAQDALELIQKRVPSLSKKWSRALNTALNSEGSTATLVRSQGGQYLAVSWRRGLLRKAGISSIGALIDLEKANGGLSDGDKVRIGVEKGTLGPICAGCDWAWGSPSCTGCDANMPKPIKMDYQMTRTLPIGRETTLPLFVLPKKMLSAVQCADEKTTLAMLIDEAANY